MIKKLLVLLTFLPLTLLGQELKCCESIEDIEAYLNGTWNMKTADSKTVYTYLFENGKGRWSASDPTEKRGEYEITEAFPFKYWISKDQGFTLNIDYDEGNWTSMLTSLNSNRMLLVSNGKETEYIKKSE